MVRLTPARNCLDESVICFLVFIYLLRTYILPNMVCSKYQLQIPIFFARCQMCFFLYTKITQRISPICVPSRKNDSQQVVYAHRHSGSGTMHPLLLCLFQSYHAVTGILLVLRHGSASHRTIVALEQV